MRFMVMVKATKDSEAGAPPTKELVDAMMAYNEELVKAGIMKGGDGLKPSSQGARVQFDGAKRFLFSTSNIVLSFLLGPLLDTTGHFYGLTLLAGGLLAGTSLVMFRTLARAARGRVGAASSA